jgi:hypothetical protein
MPGETRRLRFRIPGLSRTARYRAERIDPARLAPLCDTRRPPPAPLSVIVVLATMER